MECRSDEVSGVVKALLNSSLCFVQRHKPPHLRAQSLELNSARAYIRACILTKAKKERKQSKQIRALGSSKTKKDQFLLSLSLSSL
jgi:hypothetical protein